MVRRFLFSYLVADQTVLYKICYDVILDERNKEEIRKPVKKKWEINDIKRTLLQDKIVGDLYMLSMTYTKQRFKTRYITMND